MSRKNIKVSQEQYEQLAEDKPDGVTWGYYLTDMRTSGAGEINHPAIETLIEEWRMAAQDERGERKARVAYNECSDELEWAMNQVGGNE